MKVPVYTFQGKQEHKIELDASIFNGKVNTALLHQVIKAYQAAKRSGSAATRTRGEVKGGGKKPWRQKGTGRARVGSSRNPVWRSGGTVFGPHPRDYRQALPKKLRRQALKSALNAKLRENFLFVVDKIDVEQPKTKLFAEALKNFLANTAKEDTGGNIVEAVPKTKKKKKSQDKKSKAKNTKIPSSMLILQGINENVKRASRNVPGVKVVDAGNLNALDVLLHRNIIIVESGLKGLYSRLKS